MKEAAKNIAKEAAKKKIITMALSSAAGCSPFLLGVFVIFIAVLLVLGIFNTDISASTGLVYESEYNYENTKVVVMDGNNNEVLANVSLEDYVIGVACPEIGACDGQIKNINEQYLKAKYTAVRTYTLARGRYNSSTKEIVLKAATRDQQWCDLEKGCLITKTNHLVPGYSTSYYHYTYPGDYDRSKVDGEIYNTRSFTEEDLSLARQYYQDTYGDLILSESYNQEVKQLTYADEISYHDTTQAFWLEQAKQGKSYEDILLSTGNSNDQDAENYKNKKIYKLSSYCKVIRPTGNLVDLVNYPSYSDIGSKTKLNKPITTVLSTNDIEGLNSYIESSVNKAGYGTGEAVAAAGQSLIYGLYQKGYYLPYWYGGGHAKGIVLGVDTNWGKGRDFDTAWANHTYNFGSGRNYYSYDCSGFVSWAIKNGCKSSFSASYVSGDFVRFGKSISLKDAKPGDVIANNGHIILVVKNIGDRVIAAESTGGYVPLGGIIFTEYTASQVTQYTIVDMQNWYKNNCSSSR